MADVAIYRLHFRSPLHIGERGVGLEETQAYVPADTLFSALCTAWRWLYGVDSLQNDLLAPFADGQKPPFLLTSAFPFAGDVLFFPKPMSRARIEVAPKHEKKWRSVQYWSLQAFTRWAEGAELKFEPPKDEEEPLCWLLDEEREGIRSFVDEETGALRPWKKCTVPRVTLDRITSASQIWFFGEVVFRQGAGLWCAIRYDESSLRSRVEACLRLLGDTGLGGERGSGFGLFELEIVEKSLLPEARDTGYVVTLSPCCPDAQQMSNLLDDRCAYSLIPRRGWIGSPEGGNLRRKTVWMFQEGAVLRSPAGAVLGRLVNVKPDPCPHDVWRYGYAFTVGVNV